jgi:hypothetical protein
VPEEELKKHVGELMKFLDGLSEIVDEMKLWKSF